MKVVIDVSPNCFLRTSYTVNHCSCLWSSLCKVIFVGKRNSRATIHFFILDRKLNGVYFRVIWNENTMLIARAKWQNAYSTLDSQAVSDPSTKRAQRCLTWLIGREAVFSTWYGRKRRIYSLPQLWTGLRLLTFQKSRKFPICTSIISWNIDHRQGVLFCWNSVAYWRKDSWTLEKSSIVDSDDLVSRNVHFTWTNYFYLSVEASNRIVQLLFSVSHGRHLSPMGDSCLPWETSYFAFNGWPRLV